MLWTLPGAVRELLVSTLRSPARGYSTRAAEPLRILFCGSDAFSIESLRALHRAQQDTPGLIEAIHVLHRPAKPTGRGLKTLREVPISHAAASLHLPTTPLDTFTAWTPPTPYNLIIAVSFGLLIPARILSLSPFGGLNLHPSLLPDLRGSAPIPHALLQQRSHTGVSVQTLHPTRFDAGLVLRQTGEPGVRILPGEGREALEARLATLGADMLVDVVKEGVFRRGVQVSDTRGWYAGLTSYAPKITKKDHFVDLDTMRLSRVQAGLRALGSVWCLLPNGERLVVHEVASLDGVNDNDNNDDNNDNNASPSPSEHAGLWYDDVRGDLLFRAACGRVGIIKSSTYPGGKAGKGNAKVAKMLREQAKL